MSPRLVLLFGLTGVATACAPTCDSPGSPAFCEGDTLKACEDVDGKAVMVDTDCAASGEVCAFNDDVTTTVAAECRPADCEEGWACFPDNVGERMCDLSKTNVYVCVDEGDGCFGWEWVEKCADLGPDLSCVELEGLDDVSCE